MTRSRASASSGLHVDKASLLFDATASENSGMALFMDLKYSSALTWLVHEVLWPCRIVSYRYVSSSGKMFRLCVD